MITVDHIREGFERGEFHLEYQPVIALSDGRCVGAEALARWTRPSGRVSPSEFIPAMEETPYSGTLTYWVVETIAQELGAYLKSNPDFHVGINVPPQIIGRGGIDYAVRKSGLASVKKQLILEVTERGLPDRIGVAALEQAVRSGVRIAIDDVLLAGANLAVLTRFPMEIIKLDRSLIAKIAQDGPLPDWLAGLSALLKCTRLDVIAEGVETQRQAKVLREAGIMLAQGYLFSGSISAAELIAFRAMRERGRDASNSS